MQTQMSSVESDARALRTVLTLRQLIPDDVVASYIDSNLQKKPVIVVELGVSSSLDLFANLNYVWAPRCH